MFGGNTYGGGDAGASQFGGGGFMASPAPGHDNQFGGAGQKARNQNSSLRAFTIRHLLKETASTEDDHYLVDGQEVSTVTLVGRVTSYNEQATRVLLQLHDGTAAIEVCSWLDDVEQQAQKRIDWQVGKYVRAYGNLKTFQGKRSITAFAVKPITDHNEVTYHFLQCVMQHLHLTKGAPPTGQAPGAAMGGRPGGAPAGGAYGAPAAGGAYGGMPQGGYGGAAPPSAGPAGGDINADIKFIFNQPKAATFKDGLNVDQALAELRAMGRNYSHHQVLSACEYLAAEGGLYSTVNDSTYKSCNL